MGQALIRGLIASGAFSPRDITATDADKNRLASFGEETRVDTAGNVEAVSQSTIILLAVKPAVVLDVLDEINDYISEEQMVISIAAGVTIRQIESKLRAGIPVIRAMPNTPCMVKAGAIAFCRGTSASDHDVERAQSILSAVGKAIEVPERLMDAVTGLSGSGPAYVFVFIEAMADAGVLAGLPRKEALLLAAETVFGAAKMVIDTGEHPSRLKDAVTSPGGTTIAGLAALERASFRSAVLNAVEAAVDRSRELSQD